MNNKGLDKTMEQVKATMKLSGFHITKDEEDLIRQKVTGDISEEEFTRKTLELINQE
jgi:uncharacterized membrane protein